MITTGDNAIPQVLATAAAIVAQGEVETDIVQVTRVFHTGADPRERMCLCPEFDGHVVPAGRYVLIDDVTSMGGTLAALANYLQCSGAKVVAVIVLVMPGELNNSIRFRRSFSNWKRGTHMKSKKSSESSPTPLPPTKQTTSLVSSRLTKSEIDSLRRGKKQISDYAQKELSVKVKAALSSRTK